MAFPSTALLDNFDRADAASLGASWTDLFNGCAISSNQAAGEAAGANFSMWNVATYGPDCEAWIEISALPGNNLTFGVYARLVDTGSVVNIDGYIVSFVHQTGGTDIVRISRITNAVGTQLGADISQEFSNGDYLGIRCIGSTIYALRSSGGTPSVLGARTDATYSAAGNIAITIEGTTGRVNSFGGGTYVPESIIGTTGIAFSPSGALSLTKPLAGVTGITFSPSAALSVSKLLQGSTAFVFAPAGALSLSKGLSGNSSITFTPSGVLSLTKSLSGTTGVTFSASAAASVLKALNGTASIVFSPTAALALTKPLSGSTSIVFTATGRLAGDTVFVDAQYRVEAQPRNREIVAPARNHQSVAFPRSRQTESFPRSRSVSAEPRNYQIVASP